MPSRVRSISRRRSSALSPPPFHNFSLRSYGRILNWRCTRALSRWGLFAGTCHCLEWDRGWQRCRVGVTPWKGPSAEAWVLEQRTLEGHRLKQRVLEWHGLGWLVSEWHVLRWCVLGWLRLEPRVLGWCVLGRLRLELHVLGWRVLGWHVLGRRMLGRRVLGWCVLGRHILGWLRLERHVLGWWRLERWVEMCATGLHVRWCVPSRASEVVLTT